MDCFTRTKELSRERGLSLKRLSELSNIPYQTLMSAKKNGGRMSLDTVAYICAGLGITLSEFFEDFDRYIM